MPKRPRTKGAVTTANEGEEEAPALRGSLAPEEEPAAPDARGAREEAEEAGEAEPEAAASSSASAGAGAGASSSAAAARKAPRAPKPLSARALFKKARRERLLAHLREPGGLAAVVTPAVASAHPFPADARDHCETPFEAYRDVEPLLFRLGVHLGLKQPKAQLRVYDPYFCEGSVKRHLARLGFPRVRNENEDCYAAQREGRAAPDSFDVLVTNPPFSGDHMQRALAFAAASRKPFLMLLPQFVAKKGYFLEWLKRAEAAAAAAGAPPFVRPFFLGPSRKAYLFAAPRRDASGAGKLVEDRTFECDGPKVVAGSGAAAGAAAGASASFQQQQAFQVFSGSFQCVWFCWLGEHQERILSYWRKKYEEVALCRVTEEDPEANLPQLMAAPKATPAERRFKKKTKLLGAAAAGGADAAGAEDA